MYNMYDLARVAWWGPENLHDLARVSRDECVLGRPSPNGSRGTAVDDLSVDRYIDR